jgi:hypothetical protein
MPENAFTELATIVLHGAGRRYGAEIWLCAGDGRGESDAVTPPLRRRAAESHAEVAIPQKESTIRRD